MGCAGMDDRQQAWNARLSAKTARDKVDERKKGLRKFLSEGGARQARSGAVGEVYTIQGTRRERETGAGMTTMVTPLLDPRLKLTPRQRSVGRCYGAYAEMITGGGSSEFLREHVDGGGAGGGGVSERMMHMGRMVDVARVALRGVADVRYALGKARGAGQVGAHRPVAALMLLELICVQGLSFEAVGIGHEWVMQRMEGKRRGMVVPDRQRKHLAEALRDVLDVVDAAWQEKGYDVPYEFLTLEVR